MPFLLYDPAVRVLRHIEYAEGGGRRNQLDIYLPREGTEHAPVLLQIHGGAWIISDKSHQAKPLMLHLAARGWICVATNYRLSPKAKFPDHLIDVKRALCWVKRNIADYGGDPNFVVATGGSAGGHLSSLLALTANDPEYQAGFEELDTTVQGCVPFYGVYDFTNLYGHHPDDGMEKFLEKMVMPRSRAESPEEWERASPIHRVSDAAPPFCVIHGANDSLASVADARKLAELLREKSRAPVVYAELPTAQHAFEVFHSPRTRDVVHGVELFLARLYSDYLALSPDRSP